MDSRALPFFLAALLCGCEPPPPRDTLDARDLQMELKQLASVAAEADLLAQQLQAQHLNGSFAWVHQQSLAQETGKAASELARPAAPELRDTQQRAEALATELRLAVSRIAHAQYDPAALDGLRRQFSSLQSRAKQQAGGAQ